MRVHLLLLTILILLGCQKKHNPDILYQSDTFTVLKDKVVQGTNTAEALSRTHITSNYQSPANQSYSPLVEFKFSLNGKDNELPPGVNHRMVLLPDNGKVTSPVTVFGEKDYLIPENPEDYLEANTEFTIRLDMRPVLEAFEKDGYFTAYNGEQLAKSDFKGVYVAGGSDPLSWDFENLGNTPEFELKDPDGDGIYETTLTMNAFDSENFTSQEWKLENDISSYPTFESNQILVDALYNLSLDETVMNTEADGTFRTGAKWPGVWTRDISYSVLLAYAILEPEISKNSLRRKVNRGRIIQDTGSGGAWPVSTDRMTWALAAWEIYRVTGDRDWLREIYPIIKNSVEDDLQSIVSKETGLFKGESSFLDWRKQTYPLWMDNVDIHVSETLGTNAVHYRTMEIVARMAEILGEPSQKYREKAEKIGVGINEHLWLEDKGYYGQYLYGRKFLNLSPRSETLGEALCILFDIADEERSRTIAENTPVVNFGAPCIFPQIPGIPPYHNDGIWPFVQAYWNWATAKTGNEKALDHGLASIYRPAALFLTNKENMVAENGDFLGTQINSDRQLWSVAGNLAMVYRVFFGMDFQEDRLKLNPVIPQSYSGEKHLKNFKYRKAVLDIQISGYGNKVHAITLDGNPVEEAVIPASLEGEHQLTIEMSNKPFGKEEELNLVSNAFSLPAPSVSETQNGISWEAIAGATKYRVYENGKPLPETQGTSYRFSKDGTFAQFKVSALDDSGQESFTSEPVQITGSENILVWEAEQFSKKSSEKLTGFTGRGFVEVTKTTNTRLTFDLEIPESRTYFIDFRYSNGSGPWNTDNKCAIRTLSHGSKKTGAIVMPQRGKDEWSNWGYSNAVKLDLEKGAQSLTLSFELENENMNGELNSAMIDHLRLIKNTEENE